jgi:hypothetical protein
MREHWHAVCTTAGKDKIAGLLRVILSAGANTELLNRRDAARIMGPV